MTQAEMSRLLDLPDRTLREWKGNNRSKLFQLLDGLDYFSAKKILEKNNREKYLMILENEKHFDSLRDFETFLYPFLLECDKEIWLKLSKDRTLSKPLRLRAAYLYSFLGGKKRRLRFEIEDKPPFFHKNRPESDDMLVRYYGLKNGINTMRFEQYKKTGAF